MSENWPNFFIIGVRKGATTSLHEYLKEIDGIFMPEKDEPSFFFADEFRPSGFKMAKTISKEQYLNYYKGVTTEKFIGDGSAIYYSDPKNPELIKKNIPNAKIIFIIRNPINRTYSDYLHTFMHIAVKESFHEALQKINNQKGEKNYPLFIKDSFYFDTIKRYFETFGRKNVKIIIFEEFIKNEKETVEEVLDFLGIKANTNNVHFKKYNVTHSPRGGVSKFILKSPKLRNFAGKFIPESKKHKVVNSLLLKWDSEKPKMDDIDRDFLYKIFKEDVRKIEELLDKKVSWFDDIKENQCK